MAGDKDDLESLFSRRREIDRVLLEEHSRELAILFTDIVGSTRLFEEKGDIVGLELVRRHNDLLFPVVEVHGGWIVKTIGDAIMAVFPEALAAARCAAQMQRVLFEENASRRSEPIHIRAGVHFGRALVEDGKDVYGDAVNTAARVVNEAGADEVVLSASTVERLPQGHGLVLLDRGTFRPKGKSEPVRLHTVHWREGAPPVPAPRQVSAELFVLELGLGRDGLKVAVVDGAGEKGTVKVHADVSVSAAELDALGERFDSFLHGGGSVSYKERIRELGQTLFATALSERARQRLGATTQAFLRIQVDDALVHLPWELLHDGRDFLALRFAVGRLVSARAEPPPAAGAPNADGSAHALVVSNPSGDLDGAVREGQAVADLLLEGYGGEVRHLRGPVTRDRFEAALRGCALLHFAGHIEEPNGAGDGGFRLADGLVSPEALVRAVGSSAPPLVFANGCHAGKLASALLLHGARHFVGPRWEIADEDAMRFALRFYEGVLSGVPIGEAVRGARHALLSPGARPLSFAGYVLYGDPRDAFPAARARLQKRGITRSTTGGANVATSPPRPLLRRRALVPGIAFGAVLAAAGGYLVFSKAPAPSVPMAAAPQPVPEPGPPTPTGPVRLCVLPFKNIGDDGKLDFMREGLTEAVMTDLGQNEGFRLIERAQIDVDIQELEFSQSHYVAPETRAKLGRIHGAEVVVLGGFQRAGGMVRAQARFVRVETGEVLDTVRVDRTIAEGDGEALFELQDALSARVRESLPELLRKVRP